jgi:hypothetical protein
VRVTLAVYLFGVVIGLARVDGRAGTRLLLALAWPLGPLALVLTLGVLLLASAIAFPWFGAAAVATAVGAWALLS